MAFFDFFRPARSYIPVEQGTGYSSKLDDYLSNLEFYLKDSDIKEIYLSVNSGFWALKELGKRELILLGWSIDELTDFILELAWASRVRLDPFKPFAGGVLLAQNWRWHALVQPLSPDGPMVVLRRQMFESISLDHFEFENFTPCSILNLIKSGVSVIFFGATGSGKTTLLVSFLQQYFMDRRVGIAESVMEIPMLSQHWFRLCEVSEDTVGRGGVSFVRVVSEIMRLSPEFLVMGELRGPEAKLLPDFARTGHGGVLSTLHAGGFNDAQNRLCQISEKSPLDMPPIQGIHLVKTDSFKYLATLGPIFKN